MNEENKKLWTAALLASVKAPITLVGKKVNNDIIVEFSKKVDDPSWNYNIHRWSFTES